jgi:predicted nucleic acid-binding protein
MNYVFDSSFVGAILIPDEWNPATDKMRSGIGEEEDIYIPQLFWYEISNVFKNLIRRKRYTGDEVARFYPQLDAIRLTIDSETGIEYSKKLLYLSSEYNLGCYDAAYLELAKRKKATLCTLDEKLKDAAKKHGVAVIKQGV